MARAGTAPRLGWRHLLALLVLAILLFRPGQSSMPPVDRDEPRYAQATMQMVESGNYVDVRFQDQPRYLQPAGIYWLQSLSVRAFGGPGIRQIWIHRVPSMLGAIAAVLLTALLGSRLFGRPVGIMAAVLLASCVLLGFEARLATIDATLLAVVLLGQLALSTVYLGRDGPPRIGPALLFWAALGIGVMLKGPVIALVLFGTLAALAVSERQVRWMRRLRPLPGVLLMLVIALPWFIAIGVISGGDFFSRSVGHNFLGKVAQAQQAHGLPPGYYVVMFPLMFWPGALVAVRGLPWVWRTRRDPRVRFLLCWIVPTWLTFEVVATKLPHYVLPTYPAVAMLAAAAALAPGGWALRSWQRALFLVFCAIWLVVGVVLSVGLPAVLWWMEGVITPLTALLAACGAGAVLLMTRAALRGRPVRATAFGVAAALLVSFNAYRDVLPRLSTIWLSPRIAALVAATKPCPDSVMSSSAFSEPSLVFLVGTETRLEDVSAAAAHLRADPACATALVSAQQRPWLLALLAQDGITPRVLGEVKGINYSNGRQLDLTLYAAR